MMITDIQIDQLVHFETATDGTAVRLIVKDAAGHQVGLVLSVETLSSLAMTLPTMASFAAQRAHGDPGMRVTYPAQEFQLELAPNNLRILTIGTPDGFNVSFTLTEEFSQELGEAHLAGIGYRIQTH
jgi:hypothetical protein